MKTDIGESNDGAQQLRLLGRRIVITGAASGIGKATALLFGQEGAQLALFDRNLAALKNVQVETGADVFEVDVTDDCAVNNGVDRAAECMGGIDGVVNAAGIMLRGSVMEVSVDEWKSVLDVNLTGSYSVIRSALPWMQRERWASIVNVGSGQALLPNSPNRTAYAASKGGVINLTRALAAELAPAIRANSVCPGLVNTPMAEGVRSNTGNYALGRLAEPVEIARAILFLTSHESSYVTGVALAVDGGRAFH